MTDSIEGSCDVAEINTNAKTIAEGLDAGANQIGIQVTTAALLLKSPLVIAEEFVCMVQKRFHNDSDDLFLILIFFITL